MVEEEWPPKGHEPFGVTDTSAVLTVVVASRVSAPASSLPGELTLSLHESDLCSLPWEIFPEASPEPDLTVTWVQLV